MLKHSTFAFLVGLFFLLVTTLVWAQSGGGFAGGFTGVVAPGAMGNDSPTLIGGFTTFTGVCTSSGVAQKIVVCTSSPCAIGSPTALCESHATLSTTENCTVPALPSRWGITNVVGACCAVQGGCTALDANAWNVGVFPSTAVPLSTLPIKADARATRMVKRSANEWIAVHDSGTGIRLVTSTNGGSTWGSSFQITSLVSPTSVPAGVTSFNTLHPSLALGPGNVVNLVFAARDIPTQKSTIYYARCSNANCAPLANWQMGTRVLDPLVDETCPPGSTGCTLSASTWKYRFAFPKMVTTPTGAVHVVFDDTETILSQRIPGIFHKFCTGGTCSSTANWSEPAAGPNIVESSNQGQANGYPRTPAVVSMGNGDLYAVWSDYSTLGGSGASSIFGAKYNANTNQWNFDLTNSMLPGSGNLVEPHIASSGSRLLVGAQDGPLIRAWDCSGASCASDITPLPWSDFTPALTSLNALPSLTEFILMLSPQRQSKRAVWATTSNGGVLQLFGSALGRIHVIDSPSILWPTSTDVHPVGCGRFIRGVIYIQ